ncbi:MULTISPECIES: serine hydrolase domain-containing protein [Mycobacterium]|uniref:D-alanyl-D-alanine carboxypeptidase n=2 Tax=Mycobacterium TaxID=1763 RepID=A0A498R2W4_9MYCO|nr:MULTISPECIES: serine hydrolase domain-containing protein [Mycobacterium]EUA16641.1 beta-lactamase family protein [Mycobacterium kansasii 662]VAZ70053.1 D-alanyl-D-alanine carboxypeptidase [Mycobacterium kansasii]VBA33840.1 D-alanyl-D-alanine carboxypeptidase [Mycobacterium pseudokansasii]VBA35391.1 D-alanyl-D-alanine carboxypeptidase [Mycobacterium pseudokansasii]VBA56419.1 D-alanyl-D-alanine carboxypeptidase [Mycobacterium pseudokansasii]
MEKFTPSGRRRTRKLSTTTPRPGSGIGPAHRSRWRVLVAVLLMAVPACGHAGVQPEGWTLRLDQVIPAGMAEASVPGALIGVWKPGEAPYVRAFGLSDTTTRAPMATDMHMRIGSVTKTFTTTAILQLVDQGKVGLDDPIGKYVPGIPNGDAITLRQLGQMRSGLFDYSTETTPPKLGDEGLQRTPEELIQIAVGHPPAFPPGAQFDYNNTNTVLLGMVVQKVSGQSLTDFIRDHITQPLHMQHTVLPVGAEIPSPHAHGYTKRPSGQIHDATDFNPSWGWAAGAMVSTLDDMRIWARTVAEGALLSKAAQAQRLEFLLAPSEGTGSLYGFGLENQNAWIGHNGNISGYQSYVYYLPVEGTTLLMLVNSNVEVLGVWNFFTKIANIVSPAHSWPAPPA